MNECCLLVICGFIQYLLVFKKSRRGLFGVIYFNSINYECSFEGISSIYTFILPLEDCLLVKYFNLVPNLLKDLAFLFIFVKKLGFLWLDKVID